MSLDPQLLRNLAMIALSPEHEPFRNWLEKERSSWRDTLETTRDDKMMGVAQGRAQMLGEIQKLLNLALSKDK